MFFGMQTDKSHWPALSLARQAGDVDPPQKPRAGLWATSGLAGVAIAGDAPHLLPGEQRASMAATEVKKFPAKNRDPAHWRDAWQVEQVLGKYVSSDRRMTRRPGSESAPT
jgi:hypothetical protein